MAGPVKVKVCGITRHEDLRTALELGADAIGINLYPKSPRGVTLERARQLTAEIPKGKRVLVDVSTSPEDLRRFLDAGFDFFQIHCDPKISPTTLSAWRQIVGSARLWLVPSVAPGSAFPKTLLAYADSFVSDTYSADAMGGTGKTHDWLEFRTLQRMDPSKLWILAGGLAPRNIRRALRDSGASYVDVSSGVESAPGIKNRAKLARFFEAIRDRVPRSGI